MKDVTIAWEAAKALLSGRMNISHEMLHVIVGIVLLLLFSRLFRRPLSSPILLLPILMLELLNEFSDWLRYHLSGWPWEPWSTIEDIVLTMGPPALIVLAARLFTQPEPSAEQPPADQHRDGADRRHPRRP